jgi:hypothetical protein
MAGSSDANEDGVSSCTEMTFQNRLPKARRAGGRRRRWQHVIGTRCIVAGGFRAVRADEDAARVADLAEQRLIRQVEMLGRNAVDQLRGPRKLVHQHDGAVVVDRWPSHRGSGERCELALDFIGHLPSQRARCSDKNSRGLDIVFSLREHVGREDARVALG